MIETYSSNNISQSNKNTNFYVEVSKFGDLFNYMTISHKPKTSPNVPQSDTHKLLVSELSKLHFLTKISI